MEGLSEKPLTALMRPDKGALTLSEYERAGGYQALGKALKTAPVELQRIVKESNLRGRGGAGFNTGMKWSFVPMDSDGPKYLIANADEMEPGTFKDRMLLEGNPHQLIEGMIISAFAIVGTEAYIFLRGGDARAS